MIPLLACAIVAVAAAAAHWPTLTAGAIWVDDEQYFIENPLVREPSWAHAGQFLAEIRHPSTVEGYYQPLTMISLMLDVAWGASPQNLHPLHRTSLLLHVANSVLVVVLLVQLLRIGWSRGVRSPQAADPPGLIIAAASAGLLFALHPLTVEAIAWIAERKTTLAAFFALLSLLAYVRFVKTRGRLAYAGCVLGFFMALLAKPTATMLPLMMLVLDWWPLRRLDPVGGSNRAASGWRGRLWPLLIEKLPLFALALISGVITVISQRAAASVTAPTDYPPGGIAALLAHNIAFYAGKLLWPAQLAPYYTGPPALGLWEPAILAGIAGTLLVLAVLALSLRWTRALAASWMFWFAAILPTMGILGFTAVIAADKYMYLPMVGLFLGLAWGLLRLWEWLSAREPPAARAAILAGVALIAAAEFRQTRVTLARWSDSERLFVHTLTLQPRAGVIHNNYGNYLVRAGRRSEAMAHYLKAIEHTPGFEKGWHNLGALLALEGQLERAIPLYEQALRMKPQYIDALLSLGSAQAQSGRFAEAQTTFDRLIQHAPNDAAAHHNQGNVFVLQSRWDEAIDSYRKALELRPAYPEAELGLAGALAGAGRVEAAIDLLKRCVRTHTDTLTARLQLADLLLQEGRLDEAEPLYREIIRLHPDAAVAHNNLASVLLARGQTDAALAATREAIRLDPEYANAHFNTGTILLQQGRPAEAIPEFETALRQRPDFAKGEHYLAIALEQAGRIDEAIEHFRAAARLDPRSEQIRAGLAEALARRAPATQTSSAPSP